MTPEILRKCIPSATQASIDRYYDPLVKAMSKYDINTKERMAAFIANISHETQGLSRMVENLNYSAERLMVVFPKHFKTLDFAKSYAHKPNIIASRVYADRYGNGPESSGDGWKYRGRGAFHLTFEDNYRAAGKDLQYDFVSNPDVVETPGPAMFTAGWYWDKRNLNVLADRGDFKGVCVGVNGGLNGYDDRVKNFGVCKNALSVI